MTGAKDFIKRCMRNVAIVINLLLNLVVPLVYLYLWYAIPIYLFGKESIDANTLILSALPVIFISVISRQTTWSIGGEQGIKGDNIGRKVRATIDRKGSFEFEGIEMDEKKVTSVIESVTINQIFTDKQKYEG